MWVAWVMWFTWVTSYSCSSWLFARACLLFFYAWRITILCKGGRGTAVLSTWLSKCFVCKRFQMWSLADWTGNKNPAGNPGKLGVQTIFDRPVFWRCRISASWRNIKCTQQIAQALRLLALEQQLAMYFQKVLANWHGGSVELKGAFVQLLIWRQPEINFWDYYYRSKSGIRNKHARQQPRAAIYTEPYLLQEAIEVSFLPVPL